MERGRSVSVFKLQADINTQHYSRFPRPVALIVDGCRNANHHTGEQVARCVIVFPSGEFALKDLHEHEEQLNGLQTNPGKCGKKEEMQSSSNHRAHDLSRRNKDQESNKPANV